MRRLKSRDHERRKNCTPPARPNRTCCAAEPDTLGGRTGQTRRRTRQRSSVLHFDFKMFPVSLPIKQNCPWVAGWLSSTIGHFWGYYDHLWAIANVDVEVRGRHIASGPRSLNWLNFTRFFYPLKLTRYVGKSFRCRTLYCRRPSVRRAKRAGSANEWSEQRRVQGREKNTEFYLIYNLRGKSLGVLPYSLQRFQYKLKSKILILMTFYMAFSNLSPQLTGRPTNWAMIFETEVPPSTNPSSQGR